jgi:hypothetical protein
MRSKKAPAEILQDLPFHHRQWVVQRVGWVLAAITLVLAIGGLFGDGPLSHVRAGGPALQVEYERFIRRDSPVEIRIDVQPPSGEEVRLAVSRDYLHSLRIESIVPEPERVDTTAQDIVMIFRVTPAAESAHVTISATPLHAGTLRGNVRALGAGTNTAVSIDQFTWP